MLERYVLKILVYSTVWRKMKLQLCFFLKKPFLVVRFLFIGLNLLSRIFSTCVPEMEIPIGSFFLEVDGIELKVKMLDLKV